MICRLEVFRTLSEKSKRVKLLVSERRSGKKPDSKKVEGGMTEAAPRKA